MRTSIAISPRTDAADPKNKSPAASPRVAEASASPTPQLKRDGSGANAKLTAEEKERLRARVEARKQGKDGSAEKPAATTTEKSDRTSAAPPAAGEGEPSKVVAEPATKTAPSGSPPAAHVVVHAVGRGVRASSASVDKRADDPRASVAAPVVVHAVGRGGRSVRQSMVVERSPPTAVEPSSAPSGPSSPSMSLKARLERRKSGEAVVSLAKSAGSDSETPSDADKKSWRASLKEKLEAKGETEGSPSSSTALARPARAKSGTFAPVELPKSSEDAKQWRQSRDEKRTSISLKVQQQKRRSPRANAADEDVLSGIEDEEPAEAKGPSPTSPIPKRGADTLSTSPRESSRGSTNLTANKRGA